MYCYYVPVAISALYLVMQHLYSALLQTRCMRGDAREAMRVVFFCTHKTYLYAQNEISYEYIQILL